MQQLSTNYKHPSRIDLDSIQNSSKILPKSIKNQLCVADTFLERPGVVLGWLWPLALDPFGDHFSIKNRKQRPQGRSKAAQSRKNDQLNINAKIDAEKDMKSMPKGIQNDTKMDAHINDFFMFFRKMRKCTKLFVLQ